LALRHCRWLPPNKLNHQQAEARQGQTATWNQGNRKSPGMLAIHEN
jgi:hypothetical protein